MKEISFEMAQYLFNRGDCVYMLYPDGTEGQIRESYEINAHDGIFGIEDDKKKD